MLKVGMRVAVRESANIHPAVLAQVRNHVGHVVDTEGNWDAIVEFGVGEDTFQKGFYRNDLIIL